VLHGQRKFAAAYRSHCHQCPFLNHGLCTGTRLAFVSPLVNHNTCWHPQLRMLLS
jgi:hypothetical protein